MLLEGAVGCKLLIEIQERGIRVLIHLVLVNRRHHPFAVDVVEHILNHVLPLKENLLQHHVNHRRVVHNLHLLGIVENQSVVTVFHEEIVHRPLLLLHLPHLLAILKDRQGELYALRLKPLVAREVEEEVVEELIGSLRHHALLLGLPDRVGVHLYGQRVIGNGSAVVTSRRRETKGHQHNAPQ